MGTLCLNVHCVTSDVSQLLQQESTAVANEILTLQNDTEIKSDVTGERWKLILKQKETLQRLSSKMYVLYVAVHIWSRSDIHGNKRLV